MIKNNILISENHKIIIKNEKLNVNNAMILNKQFSNFENYLTRLNEGILNREVFSDKFRLFVSIATTLKTFVTVKFATLRHKRFLKTIHIFASLNDNQISYIAIGII